MTQRRRTPTHDKWHARVEGQIRHTIGQHPEWFKFQNDGARQACINSLAKRIVGEIVADGLLVTVTADVRTKCVRSPESNVLLTCDGRAGACRQDAPPLPSLGRAHG